MNRVWGVLIAGVGLCSALGACGDDAKSAPFVVPNV